MTYKYNKVYIKDCFTIGGIYESNGPLGKYIDKTYKKDLYFNEKSFEKAEIKILNEAITTLMKKNGLKNNNIDLIISGDLQNQISASDYAIKDFKIPFLGIFNACASSSEAIIIGSTFIESEKIKNSIIATSSHNMVAEKQFRNPTEYGTLKPKTATFTTTGSMAILLTNEKNLIKVESSTIGKIVDMGIKDPNNMGAVMAPAAADTIYEHLKKLGRDPSYYDLILTGDLGIYGKKILINYMIKKYGMNIEKNYNDCGVMLYDILKQPVYAGGSGPACSALVNFGYIFKKMKNRELKKVLIVPTGALFSPTLLYQKETIPAIAHAVGIEVVE